MKNVIIRLLCVLLLVALFACALVSCTEGKPANEEETTEPDGSTTTGKEESTTRKTIKPTVTSAEPEPSAEPVTTKEVDTSLIEVETDPEEQYSGAIDMH